MAQFASTHILWRGPGDIMTIPAEERFLPPANLKLLSAAIRHAKDARFLLTAPPPDQSTDQAYHLAGFGPECARKSLLVLEAEDQAGFNRAIGHGIGEQAEGPLKIALSLDVAAHRYEPLDWRSTYPALSAWKEDVRYDETDHAGTRGAQVEKAVAEAAEIVDRLTFELWADGRLPESFEW